MNYVVSRYEKPIETTKDLAASNRKWTGMFVDYVTALRGTTDPALARVVNNFYLDASRDKLFPWLAKAIETKRYCFALERMPGGK